MKYHMTEDGPKLCRADEKPCPIGGGEHFESKQAANSAFEKQNIDKLLVYSSRKDKFLKPLEIKPLENIDEKVEELRKSITMFPDNNIRESQLSEITNLYRTVMNGGIPEDIPYFLTRDYAYEDYRNYSTASSIIHSHLCKAGMYARVTKTFAKDLAENIKDGIVLDPMAGRGFLVKALREENVKSIGTDDNSWNLSKDIEKIDVFESIEKYGDKVSHIVLAWAPYESDIDLKVLQMVRSRYPHITIINIGEPEGGCTGSEKFWEEAKIIQPEFEIKYDTTQGIHDSVTFIK